MLTCVLSTALLWFAAGSPDVHIDVVAHREAVRVVENIYYVQVNGMT